MLGNSAGLHLATTAKADLEAAGQLLDERCDLRCPDQEKQAYEDLCLRFHDIFSKSDFDLGRCDYIQHTIQLKNPGEPVYVKQFPLPHADRDSLDSWVQELLKVGAIELSRSTFNSPLFTVQKKDGSRRIILDFRKLNDSSVQDRYAIREIRQCIDEVGQAGANVFSAVSDAKIEGTKTQMLSIEKAIRMHPSSQAVPSLDTPLGQYIVSRRPCSRLAS